jgi:FtsP/CotA-like multicopper oxidase with cupredoxin domain
MKDNARAFRALAELVVREIAPGLKAHRWGCIRQCRGQTIEAVEGDRIRIVVTDKLPEVTGVHWHRVLLRSGMDGVSA